MLFKQIAGDLGDKKYTYQRTLALLYEELLGCLEAYKRLDADYCQIVGEIFEKPEFAMRHRSNVEYDLAVQEYDKLAALVYRRDRLQLDQQYHTLLLALVKYLSLFADQSGGIFDHEPDTFQGTYAREILLPLNYNSGKMLRVQFETAMGLVIVDSGFYNISQEDYQLLKGYLANTGEFLSIDPDSLREENIEDFPLIDQGEYIGGDCLKFSIDDLAEISQAKTSELLTMLFLNKKSLLTLLTQLDSQD